MTIVELKSSISEAINGDGIGTEFFFLLDSNNGMKIKSVDINGSDQAELSEIFLDRIRAI